MVGTSSKILIKTEKHDQTTVLNYNLRKEKFLTAYFSDNQP